MSGGNPVDDLTPIPVISYNQTNNELVFNNALVFINPVQIGAVIASAESEP